jgi:hypothetical protein
VEVASVNQRSAKFPSKAAVARWLHDLGERAYSMHDEGVLHEAAELVLREWDRRKFDAPMEGDANA